MRGEFAFALFDRRSNTLFPARDRFGIKPLYYYADQDRSVFSSEMKGIFAHPDVPRSFSEEGLFHQLMQTQVPGTTPCTGIRQVPPGRFLSVRDKRNGGFHIEEPTYLDVDFLLAGEWRVTDEKDAIECVRLYLTPFRRGPSPMCPSDAISRAASIRARSSGLMPPAVRIL